MVNWTDHSFVNAFSGALSGIFTAAFVCPLDVLKTRMQVQDLSNPKYTGVVGGLSTIVREEGVRAAYRGLQPTVLALLPTWALYFSTYEFLKRNLKSSSTGSQLSPTLQYILASIGAGSVNVCVTNPLWVVKTRLQTQGMPRELRVKGNYGTNYRGTFDALSTMLRKEGMRGMYSGLIPSLIGIAHVAIQFPLYEALKSKTAQLHNTTPDALTATDLVLVSSAAKMVASTATYPHEIVQTEGLRGFYRGCATNLLRTTPAAAITFTSYEVINRNLHHLVDAYQERQRSEGSAAR